MKRPTIRCFVLILFASTITSVHAQKKDYSWGYVNFPEGDTLEGWVKDRSSGPFMDLYPSVRCKP